MEPLSGSLLIPLMIEYFKGRRDQKAQVNFEEFRTWVEHTLPEMLCTSEETFLLLKSSSETNSQKLDRALQLLEELTARSQPAGLTDLWAQLKGGEHHLLTEMFSKLVESGRSDVEVINRSASARILKELGYAHIHESSASYHVSLTSAGVVLAWAAKHPEDFASFERRLPGTLPKQPESKRLGAICQATVVNEHLADAEMELLCGLKLIRYQNNTWPPSDSAIYGVSERLIRGDHELGELLAKAVSGSKSG